MRLLANENIAPSVVRGLRALAHDVLSISESMASADDQVVLARAVAEARILLTHDKDFGELAFRSHLPASCGVMLIRLKAHGREYDVQRIIAILGSRSDWEGAFWVISDAGIRRRSL